MADSPRRKRPTYSIARIIIHLASGLVPRHRRSSWRDEWSAEVWHYLDASREAAGPSPGFRALGRCLGTFRHALWIRGEAWRSNLREGAGTIGLSSDVRHAVRSLARSPVFTATVVGTLALGLGAATSTFGVLHSVLLEPLPYPDESELVVVGLSAPGINRPDHSSAPFLHFTYVEHNRAFEEVGLWRAQTVTVAGRGSARRGPAIVVSSGVLSLLGVETRIGRGFIEADMSPESPPTVVISYGYWQRDLGEESEVVGQSLAVDGVSHEIVGVLPSGFRFMDEDVELVLPYRFDPARAWLGGFGFRSVARLHRGTSIEAATADVARMIPIAIETTPASDDESRAAFAERLDLRPNLRPLRADVVGGIGPTLWTLMGAVILLFIIAVANVANLVLVRGEERRVERGIRSALGAGRVRIAMTQNLEGLLIGGAGLGGLSMAHAGMPMLVAMAPDALPLAERIALDPVVSLGGMLLALCTGVILGALPMLRFGRDVERRTLGGMGRSMTLARGSHRALGGLVVVQVALSLVLLIGSGLMGKTYRALSDIDPGFDRPDEVQIARMSVPEGMSDDESASRILQDVQNRIGRLPGVASVGYASTAPMEETANASETLYVEGAVYGEAGEPMLRRFEFVSPAFFETIGTDIVAGRAFSSADVETGRPVALVSETLARQEWGAADAGIGQRIRSDPDEPWREVVGVVQDIYDDGPHLAPPATAFFPPTMRDFWGSATFVWRETAFAVRGPLVGTEGFERQLQEAIWDVSPDLPVASVGILSELEDRILSRHSLVLTLLAVAGALSFIIGVVGLYGVLEYVASRRVREVGLRMALGAEAGQLQRAIVRRGVLLASTGVAVGLAIAAGTTRLLSSFLFETSTVDAQTYAVVSLGLMVTAVLASYHPARRATRVSPAIAMRPE